MGIKGGIPRESETDQRLRTLTARLFRALLMGVACLSVSSACLAQETQRAVEPGGGTASQENVPKTAGQDQQSTEPPQPKTEPKKKKKPSRGAIVGAPLPISSAAIGSGIIPVLGYIFPFSTKDTVSPPSTIGAAPGLAKEIRAGRIRRHWRSCPWRESIVTEVTEQRLLARWRRGIAI
jgi:hypothetical protein